MTPAQQHATLASAFCQVAFDNLTRQLYATDASHYQIEPIAVAFPQDARQACSIIEAAAQAGVPVIPRGAGTSLTGGAIGEGVVVDFARHNTQIWDFDPEKRTVRVGAGVVLDTLNDYLRPEGFCFGPDVATSSRATIGGMIANNSSGAHTPVYGTTGDHVNELDIVFRDARLLKLGPGSDALPQQRELVENMAMFNALQIQERFPPGLLKRWPGYGLAKAVAEPGNLIHILSGSEGTLAAIVAAELKLVPLPDDKGVGLVFFNTVAEAMQAAVHLLELKPAAIEHLDHLLLDQTRGHREFETTRQMLELDQQPCESILAVEFFNDVDDHFAELEKRKIGSRKMFLRTPADMNRFWALRKSGLSLLTSRKGNAKPVTCIEDAAVRPADLAAYHAELEKLMRRLNLEASFYGHAAGGLLHVRPVLDLRSPEDLRKFRYISDEVAALVRRFKGSLAAEHGVGIARTEYLKSQVGEEMYQLMTQIKRSFDPHNLFNPGKIIGDGRYQIDSNLRTSLRSEIKSPDGPLLAFSARDGSLTANLDQCNGCGACRKPTPTMCPTFIVTGEEIMSTRGRANAIRAALELRGVDGDPLRSAELEAALSNCLGCKACARECPSNVNLALIKAELSHARIRRHGMKLRERLFSSADLLGRIGCKMPSLANALLRSIVIRELMSKTLGIAARRPLPRYTRNRFDLWFAAHSPLRPATRGRVILWDDTFVRYHEPHVGIAAVKVLEAAGFRVELARNRRCCGRPAFSQGNLDEAARLGRHNIGLFTMDVDNAPIIFVEPSCYSMFVEDYLELKLPNAERIARRCVVLGEFLDGLLRDEPGALRFNSRQENIAVHVHCHTKALTDPSFMHRLVVRLPDRKVTYLDTGCCGMAGAFGMLESKFGLSLEVAKPLIEKIRALPFGTTVVASGASCRQQIDHLATIRVRHMAEVLAEALE
ncbi:MAG TPA: FAD-linked oxidase C-terminal domain-containing protein [Verrucomicrobiota bacterium]|nr:FAD-linked oxidase C-terminal domain-containing protein [Verrucomicrobiota bacterium]